MLGVLGMAYKMDTETVKSLETNDTPFQYLYSMLKLISKGNHALLINISILLSDFFPTSKHINIHNRHFAQSYFVLIFHTHQERGVCYCLLLF